MTSHSPGSERSCSFLVDDFGLDNDFVAIGVRGSVGSSVFRILDFGLGLARRGFLLLGGRELLAVGALFGVCCGGKAVSLSGLLGIGISGKANAPVLPRLRGVADLPFFLGVAAAAASAPPLAATIRLKSGVKESRADLAPLRPASVAMRS